MGGNAARLSALADGVFAAATMADRRYAGARHWRARARLAKAPGVAIVDSTFVKSSYGGAGCVISGLKRAKGLTVHAAIDARSNILALQVWPGSAADARVAHELLPHLKAFAPSVALVLGDKAYRGEPLQQLAQRLGVALDASSPPLPADVRFEPQPLRWRIEQFFSWLVKWRRLARVWAYGLAGYALDLAWAAFGLQLRRSARAL